MTRDWLHLESMLKRLEFQIRNLSFYNYTLSFFPDKKPIINTFRSLSEIPVSSPESDAMSKDMKKRGFKFFGTTICYAHLQASGFINDHLTDCICRKVPQQNY